MKYPLYLASDSSTRKELLHSAQIPFVVISHSADENQVAIDRPLPQIVDAIAQLKMDHLVMPQGSFENQEVFVVTADTMTLVGNAEHYEFFGKPQDREHAKYMLKVARDASITGTAVCVQKMVFIDKKWHRLDRQTSYAEALAVIDIPDDFVDFYLDRIDFLNVSGAIKIRGLAEQFTKEIRGSYTAIMGLPMYELRETLNVMGFYRK